MLTDIPRAKARVLDKISDHRKVIVSVPFTIPEAAIIEREVWCFDRMDVDMAQDALAECSWTQVVAGGADAGAQGLADTIMGVMQATMPRRTFTEKKSSHPWLNRRVLDLVARKQLAEGTVDEATAIRACSAGIMEEFQLHTAGVRKDMRSMQRGCKQWWKKTKELMDQRARVSSIPALKTREGEWVTSAADKANLFAKTFNAKCSLPPERYNDFSIQMPGNQEQPAPPRIEEQAVEAILQKLDENSATGPDLLPTRVLKQAAGPSYLHSD